jgi:hypothetical protein
VRPLGGMPHSRVVTMNSLEPRLFCSCAHLRVPEASAHIIDEPPHATIEHYAGSRLRRAPHRTRLLSHDNRGRLLAQTLDDEGIGEFLTAPAETINVLPR